MILCDVCGSSNAVTMSDYCCAVIQAVNDLLNLGEKKVLSINIYAHLHCR